MKRGLLVLLGVLVLALATAVTIWWMHRPASADDWLRERYGLDAKQAATVSRMQAEYRTQCVEMCARISAADQRLSEAIRGNTTVTPELRVAIAETDKVRTDCRVSMLAHFYDVASMLPKEKRADYLQMVLPAVLRPEEMAVQHVRP